MKRGTSAFIFHPSAPGRRLYMSAPPLRNLMREKVKDKSVSSQRAEEESDGHLPLVQKPALLAQQLCPGGEEPGTVSIYALEFTTAGKWGWNANACPRGTKMWKNTAHGQLPPRYVHTVLEKCAKVLSSRAITCPNLPVLHRVGKRPLCSGT